MPDNTNAPLEGFVQSAIEDVKAGKLPEMKESDVRQIVKASELLGGDHFGIPDDLWARLERIAYPAAPQAAGADAKRRAEQETEEKRWAEESKRLEYQRMVQWANEQTRKVANPPPAAPPPATPQTEAPPVPAGGPAYDDGHNFGWRARSASPPSSSPPPDVEQQERDQIIQGILEASPVPEPDATLVSTGSAGSPVDSPGGGSRKLLIGGGALALLMIVGVVITMQVAGQSKSAASSSPGAAVHSAAASAATRVTSASATIGGIGENSTKNPALVVCQIRGTVLGMEFLGTLSGPNIGSSNFDVKSGQPSQGVTPVSPDEAVFALAFPGTGGQSGGGPSGPFTCTLTSVDVPSGYTLAPHQPSDWTMTVP